MKRKQRNLITLVLLMAMCVSLITPRTAEAASGGAVKSVTLKVNKKKVNSKTITVYKGSKTKLAVIVNPSKAKKLVKYTTSKRKVATVSKGSIIAKATGTAKITVKVKGKNNKTKTAWVKVKVVKAPTAVKSVTLKVNKKKVNSKTITLPKGWKTKLAVTVSPSGARKSIKYTTSNKKVATISKGVITAKKEGTAKITVKVKGKNNKTKTVWLKVKVTKHVHKWKAHKVTKKVWAPKKVTVTDYETFRPRTNWYYVQTSDPNCQVAGSVYFISDRFEDENFKKLVYRTLITNPDMLDSHITIKDVKYEQFITEKKPEI